MDNVTYEYYTNVYGGMSIPEELFIQFAKQAMHRVDALVSGKLSAGTYAVDDAVRNAVCAVSEIFHAANKRSEKIGVVASETVGRHSVTYQNTSAENEQKSILEMTRNAAYQHLFPTGLLYKGVTCGANKHCCNTV